MNFKVGSLEGFKARSLEELTVYCKNERIWESADRELEAELQEPKKYSLSPLGRLLEDLIFSSKSLKDCLQSFGKESSSAEGLLTFIVLQIPVVGGTFYTVMEFYGLGSLR